ncbi:hypothetical protein [Candidatus Similichlamydia laticola]|uniref:Uncharacterized protein n=1 Tax=Candidatus Similichlamydia laticola TaxID=2170265 RepID=A0A369KGI4_9BACT|nr:hypothetical protein [Candidatus Similichlamydia laticola]RDB31815.1 hypothetical protein HAT2_00076 [Candidatus Similichlamydia laticola]RDB31818.1 hypothetical protein HAT2_00073 [Candidatus Similichlamydia laticola]
MFAQHYAAQGALTTNWNVSPDQQPSCGKLPAPTGDTQEVLFQRMMEGVTTQTINAVALIAPEEIIRKMEQQKRRSKPSVFLARKQARRAGRGGSLARFESSVAERQKRRQPSQNKTAKQKEMQLADSLKRIFGQFCGLIVNSERDLSTLEKQLTHMTQKDSSWHPAQLYLVQVRVSHLSQKIEFFTSLMNKALESSKQIMNTQI